MLNDTRGLAIFFTIQKEKGLVVTSTLGWMKKKIPRLMKVTIPIRFQPLVPRGDT